MKLRMVVILSMVLLCIPSSKYISTHADASTGGETLARKMQPLLQAEPLRGAIAGISVRSARTGEILYESNGHIRLRPASNMKLLTAAAALEVLGKDYRFRTKVFHSGPVRNHRLEGNLYIQGGGDPSLLKTNFDQWAGQLKKQGISRISGDLVADDSRYDNVRYSLDLPWSDEDKYYGAQISALTASPNTDFDAGTVIIDVSPADQIGKKAALRVTPDTGYVTVDNQIVTVQNGEQHDDDIIINRVHGTNHFAASGTITADTANVRHWKAVWDPSLYALSLFKKSLTEKGITIEGGLKRGAVPKQAEPILTHESQPLFRLLVPFMKLSNNTIAEMLVKEIGKVQTREGSWEKGLHIVKEKTAVLGADPDQMLIRDGSGVSHVDLIPANEITKLLYNVQRKDWFQAYLDALPVAGEKARMKGGTLRERLVNTPASGHVFAKTGSITSVSSLSGYVHTKSSGTLIFSILINQILDEEQAKDVEDQIVSMLREQ
ncbi:D-alanyl-D-alanine carboxypeptidase/D-alanyl-D-alanine endopeptidase [Heyndrickxia acidiproducens]|uniref:D-alanyl-D-alanine carboxypeptidase/D-alanyl-D-alanine endopeptidase n=1 Tax=Heyndrickxia acidiproducens TaxID=1121084 RepID=UPI000476CDD2|nr:D-alanyl-D-alanine carboxypeptidase/D-alanyl-D-alanine-endopeptidase [Heyndrickxia acidiproducens]